MPLSPRDLAIQGLAVAGQRVGPQPARLLNGAANFIESGRRLRAQGIAIPRPLRTRFDVFDVAITVAAKSSRPLYLEFGVWQGETLGFWAARLDNPQARFVGFDSFEGLPEKWGGFDLGKGALTMHGKLPRVPGNVVLHKGWFSDTLPVWSKENPGLIAFMHVDCDIYSSTVDIFRDLASQIGPGTVVLFDEYFNYPNWENHEYKAWKEFAESRGITYTYLGFARQQVALRIDSVRTSS